MRAVLQRASKGHVSVAGEVIGTLSPTPGIVALIGVGPGDTEAEAVALAKKIATLRILADEQGVPNLSVLDTGGGILVISQFTLFADTRRGRRPGYSGAARPERAEPLVAKVASELVGHGIPVATGRFGAEMQVSLTNDGPLTILLDTEDWK